MDRNSIIGILIIAGIFVVWGIINRPSAEEIERQKQKNDSIALERLIQEKKQQEQLNEIPVEQKQIAPEETV